MQIGLRFFFSKMLRFQHQGYQMKALLKVDEEYQISDIYSLDFTIFSSKIKNFLPLSRQTNDKFGIFFVANFFKFFKNEMDWGSKIKEFFFFPPPLSTFKLIEKQLFPSCLSSKRTIILVIFFQIFKAYLGKKSWWNLTWICWKWHSKFDLFQPICQNFQGVEPSHFSSFHGILRHKI